MSEELIALGVIARPHGVQGAVRVHPFNPSSSLLLEQTEVVLKHEGGDERRVAVRNTRPGPKAILMELDGVEGREAAEALRGVAVCVPRSALPPADEDEFYFVDLVGLAVREGEAIIGTVTEVVEYPSADCLRVELDAGHVEIPMMPQWIVEVDLEAGEITVHDISDLPAEKN